MMTDLASLIMQLTGLAIWFWILLTCDIVPKRKNRK
jgi:hypothetical protein